MVAVVASDMDHGHGVVQRDRQVALSFRDCTMHRDFGSRCTSMGDAGRFATAHGDIGCIPDVRT